jgi:hypothetical protein
MKTYPLQRRFFDIEFAEIQPEIGSPVEKRLSDEQWLNAGKWSSGDEHLAYQSRWRWRRGSDYLR